MSSSTIAIERAIEVAEHNGWYTIDGALIVWDSLRTTATGTRLEVGMSRDPRRPGFWAMCRDGVGRQVIVAGTTDHTREQVAHRALGSYLDMLNNPA